MTMENPATEKQEQIPAKQPQRKRRRRTRGVPTALVAMLLVLALFFGGLFGFIIANKTNPYARRLEEANERITSLENYLTMMGFSEENTDPEGWIFDDTGVADEAGDLSGFSVESGSGDVTWDDESLIDGMLKLEGDPVVVAEFEGGTLMSDEVIDPYNDALATQIFGFSDAADVSGDVLNDVLHTLAADKILYARAEELGLTALNDDDLKVIQEEAQAFFDEQKSFYASAVETAGMTDEEADAAVIAYMRDDVGVTLEGMVEDQKQDYWIHKLYDHVTEGAAATDEEVRAAYDELLADQQETFGAYPEEYEYAMMNDEIIAYNPEGYRRVKHILLAFEDDADEEQASLLMENIAMMNPETQMDEIAELQSQLDALYTELDAKAETVIAELNAGADFDALIEKYGMDSGMDLEPAKTEGYYVAANSIQWSADFIEGSMMLEQVGQVSTPVHSVGGVHIIKYIGDVTPGAVPFDEVKDALSASVLDQKRQLLYEETVAQWITEANVKYYPERLQ